MAEYRGRTLVNNMKFVRSNQRTGELTSGNLPSARPESSQEIYKLTRPTAINLSHQVQLGRQVTRKGVADWIEVILAAPQKLDDFQRTSSVRITGHNPVR